MDLSWPSRNNSQDIPARTLWSILGVEKQEPVLERLNLGMHCTAAIQGLEDKDGGTLQQLSGC